MAKTEYHITPDGVQKCKRMWGKCPYSTHYVHLGRALQVEQEQLAEAAKPAKIAELEKAVRDMAFVRARVHVFNFGSTPDGARKFAVNADAYAAAEMPSSDIEVPPMELFSHATMYNMRNGSSSPVVVHVVRQPKVDKEAIRIVSEWKLSLETTTSITLGLKKISENMTLDFSSPSAADESFDDARKFFEKAVKLSGLRDEAADEKIDSMVNDLRIMRDIVDSEIDGDFALWEEGRGYFKDSGYDSIVVDADYKKSAFRGENVKRFFRENVGMTSNPEVQIKVTERNERFSTSWSMHSLPDGTWNITTVMQDGTTQVSPAPNPDEIYNRVFWDFHDYVNINKFGEPLEQHEESRKRAEYAKKLMIDVAEEHEKNQQRIAASQEEEQKNKQQRVQEMNKTTRKKRFGF